MARALLLVAAILAAGWFALGVRQARDLAAATSIVSSGRHLSPGEARRARGLLNAAGVLNPDSSVDLLRAQLDRDQRDFRRARLIIEQVLAGEPDNLMAWYALGLSAVGSPDTAERALRSFARLVAPGQ